MKAQMFRASWWTDVVDPWQLFLGHNQRLLEAEFDVLGFQSHYFCRYSEGYWQPRKDGVFAGWSGLWLLGESHLAIHSFPDQSRSCVELSSCVQKQYRKFLAGVSEHVNENYTSPKPVPTELQIVVKEIPGKFRSWRLTCNDLVVWAGAYEPDMSKARIALANSERSLYHWIRACADL